MIIIKLMNIGNHKIGINNPTFVIAEAGVNYNNKLNLAFKMIDIAANSGADAIKFQTWNTDLIQLKNSVKPSYQKKIHNHTYYEIIKNLEPSKQDQKKIFERCKKKQIIFLSTPYDEESVDFLDNLGVPAFKISSSDLTNHILLKHVAKKKKPIIISTGLSNMDEVKETIKLFKKLNMNNKLILMQATSNYPTPPEDVNLNVIPNFIKTFNIPIGFSDHTQNSIASLGAIALGAILVEKHFTLSRKFTGPDQLSSMEPNELKNWIRDIRYLEKCVGATKKIITPSDQKNISMKKIIVINPINKGDTIKEKHLMSMRGNQNGLIPLESNIRKIIGKKIKVNIKTTTQFSLNMI
jgi:N,N'-diacetyllegionaminate synthase